MRTLSLTIVLLSVALLSGCPGLTTVERNAFLTAAESYGASLFGDSGEGGGGGGTEAETGFRSMLTLTLANHESDAELNTSFIAWVSPSSIRSGTQQDALLEGGYIQLNQQVQLGSAYTLVVGTFVYSAGDLGEGGTNVLRLDPATPGADENDPATATEAVFEMITPDVILVFSQPPVGCDTPAFYFTLDGLPFDITPESQNLGAEFGGATGAGPVKTLGQFDVYQCNPFQPGLFLRTAGGSRAANEYIEGEDIRIDFTRFPDAADNAAFVTIGQ
jgi:hypothetical protein